MHTPEKGKFEEEWKNAFEGAELTPSKGIWNSVDSRLSQAERSGGGFEKGWERAFQGAEVEPSERVWKAIDVALVQAENVSIKKRVVFYQRLAAASVGIMIMFAAYSWFSPDGGSNADLISELKGNGKQEMSGQSDSSAKAKIESNLNSSANANQNTLAEKALGNGEHLVQSKLLKNIPGSSKVSSIAQVPGNASLNSRTIKQVSFADLEEENTAAVAAKNTQPFTSNGIENRLYRYNGGPVSTVETVALGSLPDFFGPNDYAIAYRLADARPAVLTKKKEIYSTENQWASVGFSAGSFNPGVGGGEVSESLNSIRMVKTSSPAFIRNESGLGLATKSDQIKSGSSIAMALSGGKRLFKRWILQGGVTYLNQTSATESEIVSVAQANQVQDEKSGYSLESTNTVTYDELQKINSNFQFVSVPLQIGYMVLDNKIGIQVNGGFSPDFLMKNTVYNETTGVETSNSTNDTGNLKTVSVSGIGGFEVSYRFLNHYRLSLVPGVKYSLTPLYSDNSLASAKPFVADIGLRFRYIF